MSARKARKPRAPRAADPPPPPPEKIVSAVVTEAPPPERPQAPAAAPLPTVAVTPLASIQARTPGAAAYRVSKMVDGSAVYLGKIGNRASHETLISTFPLALPLPGQTAEFLAQGLSALGEELGRAIPIAISGDSPEVQASRARVIATAAPAPASAASPDPALKKIEDALSRLEAREKEILAAERAQLKAREDAVALAARTVADEQKAWWEQQLAKQKADHEQALERERTRREQDRKDDEERHRREREERDERNKREDLARERERDRDREHQERMAKLTAAQSLESLLPKGVAFLTTLGLKPGELLGNLLGKGDGAIAEGLPGAIAAVVGKLSDNIADVVKVQMELRAAEQTGQPPSQATIRRMLTPKADPPPPPPEKPDPPRANRPTTTGTPGGLPLPVVRNARVALRELLGELRALDPDKWEGAIVAFYLAKKDVVEAYVKAIGGLRPAAIEAGATAAEADQFETIARKYG